MSKRAALLVLFALAACGEKRKDPPPDVTGARARGGQAFSELAPELEKMGQDNKAARVKAELEAAALPPKAKVFAQDSRGCTWIDSQALVTAGEHESRHQVRAAAIAEARLSAIQDFLGVDIRSRFMDYRQEGLKDEQSLTENILQTTRLGRIIDEKVLGEGFSDLEGCKACRYGVQLRSCVLPLPSDGDKQFAVELGLSRTRFVEGDEAKITVSSTRDAYVYLFNVGPDWSIVPITPVDGAPGVLVKAGQPFLYPDDEALRRGVKLVAELPQGHKVSAETLRVIAVKVPLSPQQSDMSGGFLGMLRRLNASRVEWTDDATAFTIYGR